MKKKLLAWALLLCMLATLLPVSAFAEGEIADAPAEQAEEAETVSEAEEVTEDAAPFVEDAGQSEAEENDGEEPPQSAEAEEVETVEAESVEEATHAEDASPIGGGAEHSEAEGETDGEEPPQSADADSSPEGGAEEVAEETLSLEAEIEEEVSEELDAELADDNIVASGTCGTEGDNLTWTLDADGLLTISGTGGFGGISYDYNNQIKSVILNDGVTRIGDSAFEECSNLMSVSIPNSVTSIDWCAFYDCSSLTSVTIPSGVNRIAGLAFAGCSALTEVEILSNNVLFDSDHGVFSNCSGLKTAGPVDGGYNIEFSWTDAIPDYAFQNCGSLTSVTIPEGVTTVGDYAFSGTALEKIVIPSSMTTVGADAFSCPNLKTAGPIGGEYDIELNWTITTVANILINFPDLTSVTIPNSVTTIADFTFIDCGKLENVTIPDGVTTIGEYAFSGCRKLANVRIPDGVTTIGEYAFSDCAKLTSAAIPVGVTTIGQNTFFNCGNLSSVTIPPSVTTIGYQAFYQCRSLDLVRYVGTEDRWNQITIKPYNDELGAATIEYIPCSEVGLDHTPAQAVRESEVQATASVEGGYDMVVRCSVCGEELSRENTTLPKLIAPKIGTQPKSCSAAPGKTASFSVSASGSTLKYQWYVMGNDDTEWKPAAGGTGATLSFTATVGQNGSRYYCKVSNDAGSVSSTAVTLTVTADLEITMQPKSVSVSEGGTANFTVTAKGSGLKYQWYSMAPSAVSWTKISGATAAGYKVTAKKGLNGTRYYCEVSNSAGTVKSSAAKLTVTAAKTGWVKADGKWTYYNSNGAMVKGWQKISGKWYYFNTSGVMQTGWQKVSSKWYYFNGSGAMLTGWQKISNKWYYFNSSGAMLTGWQKISSKWYYFESSGAMKTGWLKLSGKWYYFESSGAMVTGSKKIGSKTYNFNSSGVCQNP